MNARQSPGPSASLAADEAGRRETDDAVERWLIRIAALAGLRRRLREELRRPALSMQRALPAPALARQTSTVVDERVLAARRAGREEAVRASLEAELDRLRAELDRTRAEAAARADAIAAPAASEIVGEVRATITALRAALDERIPALAAELSALRDGIPALTPAPPSPAATAPAAVAPLACSGAGAPVTTSAPEQLATHMPPPSLLPHTPVAAPPGHGRPVTAQRVIEDLDAAARRLRQRADAARSAEVVADPATATAAPSAAAVRPSVSAVPLSVSAVPLSVSAVPLSVSAVPLSVSAVPLSVSLSAVAVSPSAQAVPLSAAAAPPSAQAVPLSAAAAPPSAAILVVDATPPAAPAVPHAARSRRALARAPRRRSWLTAALQAIAEEDPAAAARMISALAPVRHLPGLGAFECEVAVTGFAALRVTLTPVTTPRGGARAGQAAQKLELEGPGAALVWIAGGGAPRRLRGVVVSGPRRTRRRLLAALRAPVTLATLASAPRPLDPEPILQALAHAVEPHWISGPDSAVAHRITGDAPATWTIRARSGQPLMLSAGNEGVATATVTLPAQALLPYLIGVAPPAGATIEIAGDIGAASRLAGLLKRAQQPQTGA